MEGVAVLGLGNVLQGDDAVGPYAVRCLEARYEFPEEVAVLDLGTPGLDLVPYLAGRRAAVIVDAVRSDAPAGTVRLYRRDEILRHAPETRVNAHDPSIKEALLSLEFAGRAPVEVALVGVVPERTDRRVGMTVAVLDALPAVETEILRELERLGAGAVPRAEPRAPDLWWER